MIVGLKSWKMTGPQNLKLMMTSHDVMMTSYDVKAEKCPFFNLFQKGGVTTNQNMA